MTHLSDVTPPFAELAELQDERAKLKEDLVDVESSLADLGGFKAQSWKKELLEKKVSWRTRQMDDLRDRNDTLTESLLHVQSQIDEIYLQKQELNPFESQPGSVIFLDIDGVLHS